MLWQSDNRKSAAVLYKTRAQEEAVTGLSACGQKALWMPGRPTRDVHLHREDWNEPLTNKETLTPAHVALHLDVYRHTH